MPTPPADPYRRRRFPAWVIAHAVWLCHTFALSLRDVALVLAERGVDVSHETVRRWCAEFGGAFAERLRRCRRRPGATWHLDEVFARVAGGRRLYLWRAVDQRGAVLGTLVQARRDAAAARRFLARLLARLGFAPRILVTDGLRSYAAAKRGVLPRVAHRVGRWLNNRAEEAHRPVRRRERQMQRFKSTRQAQRFLSAHGIIHAHFRLPGAGMAAAERRRARARAFRIWRRETCARATA
jgi:putative transposase